jgi:hypothetical protein
VWLEFYRIICVEEGTPPAAREEKEVALMSETICVFTGIRIVEPGTDADVPVDKDFTLRRDLDSAILSASRRFDAAMLARAPLVASNGIEAGVRGYAVEPGAQWRTFLQAVAIGG